MKYLLLNWRSGAKNVVKGVRKKRNVKMKYIYCDMERCWSWYGEDIFEDELYMLVIEVNINCQWSYRLTWGFEEKEKYECCNVKNTKFFSPLWPYIRAFVFSISIARLMVEWTERIAIATSKKTVVLVLLFIFYKSLLCNFFSKLLIYVWFYF